MDSVMEMLNKMDSAELLKLIQVAKHSELAPVTSSGGTSAAVLATEKLNGNAAAEISPDRPEASSGTPSESVTDASSNNDVALVATQTSAAVSKESTDNADRSDGTNVQTATQSSAAASKESSENPGCSEGSNGALVATTSKENVNPATSEVNSEAPDEVNFIKFLKTNKVDQYTDALFQQEIKTKNDFAALNETDIDSFCQILKHKSVFRQMLKEVKLEYGNGDMLSKDEKFEDLEEYLMSQDEGYALIQVYKTQHKFDNNQRNELVKLILLAAARRKKTMHKRFNVFVANKIAELFPGEEAETYYQPSILTPEGKTTTPSGKLIKRKTIVFQGMNVSSPSSSQAKRKKLVFVDDVEDDSVAVDSNIQAEAKKWLVRGRTPDELILDQWNACYSLRRTEIRQAETLAEILTQYPILKEPKGGQLLNIDFDRRFPEANRQFQLKFPLLHDKLLPLLKKARMDTHNLRRFNLYNETENNALKDYLLCSFLPILIQTNYKVQKDWRPSIVEVQDYFFIEVNTPSDVEDKLTKTIQQLEKDTGSKSLQPHIVVVGPLETAAFLVMFGGAEYRAGCVQDAIRLCLSICFVLDLKYPLESAPVWDFIQSYLFEIPSIAPAKSCQKLLTILNAA